MSDHSSPSMRRAPGRLAFIAAAAAMLICALAVCSSGNAAGDPSSSSNTSSNSNVSPEQQQVLNYYRCLRDHGVDIADPTNNDGKIRLDGIDENDPTTAAALQACQSQLPGGGEPPKPDAKTLEGIRKFAQCMRDQGVDMPAPEPDGRINMPDGVTTDSPAFQACHQILTDAIDGKTP